MSRIRRRNCGALALLVFTCAATATAFAAPLKVNGRLSKQGDISILRIWGTAEERGFAHGYIMAPQILHLLNGYLDQVLAADNEKEQLANLRSYNARALMMKAVMRIEPQYAEELKGMLAGIEARLGKKHTVLTRLKRTLTYDDLVATNCIPDAVRMGCSSFAAWGPITASGHTIAGRNLDWTPMDILVGNQIVIAHIPEPGSPHKAWVSVTWPGVIGCLTGMNAEGVTVSMHDVWADKPSIPAGYTPRALALRDAVETAGAENPHTDVEAILSSRVVAVGNNVHVTAPFSSELIKRTKHGPSYVFEYDGNLTQTRGVTLRTTICGYKGAQLTGNFFQVCTNHYCQRAKADSCNRFREISRRLEDPKAASSTKAAWDILRSVAQSGGIRTYHSVVFQPNLLKMHVAVCDKDKPAPMRRPTEIRLGELLKRPVGAVQPQLSGVPN